MPGPRLTCEERVMIQNGLDQGLTQDAIAKVLGKSPSTISREVRRGGGPRCSRPGTTITGRPRRYRADRAQRLAIERGRRPKPHLLAGELAAVVTGLLEADWSPQQISQMLPTLFPDDEAMRVSHETIYQSLFVQGRGELRRELAAHLRSGRTGRRSRAATGARRAGRIAGMVPISQRPATAADRAVPGHWEGDLLLGGTGKGAVITLVERTSRFVLLAPLPDSHKALDVRTLLTGMITALPDTLTQSLTWDQGNEMAQHAQFTLDTGLQVYFCDPHSPWQRGSNENTNGLLRQYWPKGSDLRHLTQTHCDTIAQRLNTRPRKTLNWHTPAQTLDKALLATTS
ncbi:IS30 family transposase [Amycolatopsis sp. 195334CR]|uniref:IS30 family transposase n=1 Tax=Amycolatopsis sp. 195334CR TaxID=2814588 RepID=UPI0024145F07|nr:IS30 family transposase [Amycolatopsis sp. 195334CR]